MMSADTTRQSAIMLRSPCDFKARAASKNEHTRYPEITRRRTHVARKPRLLTLPTTVLVRARERHRFKLWIVLPQSARPALASDSSTSSFALLGLFVPSSQPDQQDDHKMITTTTTQPLPEEELDPVNNRRRAA